MTAFKNRSQELVQCGEKTPLVMLLQKLFGHQMAEFRIVMETVWQNDGSFTRLDDSHQEPIVPQQVKLKPRKNLAS